MSTVETLNTDDNGADSRVKINDNFTALNTDKLEGPASATDNALARFDSTTGKLIEDGTVSASDVTGGQVIVSSIGNNDLVLQTGNANTSKITITDGVDGNVTILPDGDGQFIYQSNSAGGTGAVFEAYSNSPSPAVLDVTGFLFTGNNSIGSKVNYGAVVSQIGDPTSGAESSIVAIGARSDGVFQYVAAFAPGLIYPMSAGTLLGFTGVAEFDSLALKSGGSGSKLFSKATPTTASWTAVSGGEGTDNLATFTFLNGTSSSAQHFFTVDSAGDLNTSYFDGISVTDSHTQVQALGASSLADGVASETRAYNDAIYYTKGSVTTGLGRLNGATNTINEKTTALFPYDYATGDEQIGIFGFRTFPSRAQLLLWDSASLLIDQRVEFGPGRGVCVGYVNGFWVGVVNEGLDTRASTFFAGESNANASFSIKVATGAAAETIYQERGVTNTNGIIKQLDGRYRDGMLFYARVPQDATPTTYKQGIYAVGRTNLDSPLAVSVLLDTSSLGIIECYHNFGQHHFFGHNEDGSISRLDTESGTYDVPATIETLIYGAETPYLKDLNGLSITTENLPSGASVQAEYRTDVDSAWVSMGVSDILNKQTHNFTKKSDGTVIGKFREIQFRITLTGKIIVKNLLVSTNELNDLSF